MEPRTGPRLQLPCLGVSASSAESDGIITSTQKLSRRSGPFQRTFSSLNCTSDLSLAGVRWPSTYQDAQTIRSRIGSTLTWRSGLRTRISARNSWSSRCPENGAKTEMQVSTRWPSIIKITRTKWLNRIAMRSRITYGRLSQGCQIKGSKIKIRSSP